MKQPDILLINCNPKRATGGQLESILAMSHVSGRLQHEVIVDSGQIELDNHLTGDFDPSLVFLILLPEHLQWGGSLIESIKEKQPETPIIVVTEECGAYETLELLQRGASDFITTPLKIADTLPRIWRSLEQFDPQESMMQKLKAKVGLKFLIGQADNFLSEIKKIPLIAKCDSRVLISGETGTGKEMCARAIHYLSPRMRKPFVPINCGAIPADLVENELFGHARGAFTGANSSQSGLIQEAEGGTLFLDEIDCLPLMAQTKLLRFLQEGEYRPLGSSKMRQADVRVIAASNAQLEEAVQKGRLRHDLYYRLKVISLVLPPLRERREDIAFLASYFTREYAAEFNKELMTLSPEVIRKLTSYAWPGNVRELKHTIEHAVIFSETNSLTEADIVLPVPDTDPVEESFQQAKEKIIERFEKEYIQRLLLSHNGNISRSAQAARKNRRAFWELIRKHDIDVSKFRPSTS
ncbi:MAG TPA: sigma-54 dependent transcriptional regulator [Pyrinomonadaceae bacterium]|nr:sigma-54 dependent transcriptional regulator [Pyrinomonadaceae bacterium]